LTDKFIIAIFKTIITLLIFSFATLLFQLLIKYAPGVVYLLPTPAVIALFGFFYIMEDDDDE
jgi:uncharacterized membrane protein YGL010W